MTSNKERPLEAMCKKRKTEYGHIEYECPVCGKWLYPQSLRRHISDKAMGWTSHKEKEQKEPEPKHRDFYLKYSVLVEKREWII